MAVSLSNKKLITYFFVILLLSIIIGSVSLTYPFGRDQGIYAYIAKLILNGKIDYKYSYNLRPPGTHYAFALGQLLFGKSMLGMRVFDLMWQSFTAFIIFQIVFLLTGKRSYSFISAGLYLIMYFRLDYWHTMQTEGFMNLPFALCVLLLIKPDKAKDYIKYFLAGVFFAVASIFKFTIATFMVLLVILILLDFKNEISGRTKKVIAMLSGSLLFILAVLAYYFFNNALSELLEVQFVQIPHYAKIGFETETSGFITSNIIRLFFYSVYSPLIFLSFVLLIYLIYKKNLSRRDLILFIWLFSSLLGLIMQWKFFYYHFLIIVPPLIVCSIYCAYIIGKEFRERFSKYFKISSVIVLLVFLLLALKLYFPRIGDLYNYISGSQSLNQLYIKNGITTDSVFSISKIYKLTKYVKQNTRKGDRIYVWGIEPLIYYLSGRDCVSRFTYNTPLYWRGDDSRYQKEFIRSIKKDNPELVLVAQRDPMYNITGYKEDSEQMLKKFSEFKEIIDKSYVFKSDIKEFKIYQLLKPFSN